MTTSNLRLGLALAAAAVVAVTGFFAGRHSVRPLPSAPPAATERAGGEGAIIPVSAEAISLMDIEVLRPLRGSLGTPLVLAGLVTASPDAHAVITARVPGSITRIEKRVGDRVRRGEALAALTSRDAASLLSQQRAAEARQAQAAANLVRERQLFEQRVTPRQDLEAAEAAATAAAAEAEAARLAAGSLRYAEGGRGIVLVSPIDGRVTRAPAVLGGFVDADTELFRVSDPRRVQVQASLPVGEAAAVAVGDSARILTQRGTSVEGRVLSVSPAVDPATGAASATLSLSDSAELPAVGESVRAYLQPQAKEGAEPVLPAESVQMLDGREVVFVRVDGGFRAQPVSVGARSGTQVSIRQGLTGEESVAGRNAFLLKAEATKGAEEEE